MSRDLQFSVLLPVYAGDRADHFLRAFDSATVEQELRPSEVILVQDGPVPGALAEAIRSATAQRHVPVLHHELPTNVRLAAALQAGLQRCSYDVIARADADDISVPSRFAVQVPLVADGLDLVGSAMQEFDSADGSLGPIRPRPESTAAILRYASFHNPFNHPTVVFRRSAVMAAGGYEDLPFMEDYWLFARMLAAGATARNVREALVRYRTGDELFARRGGWQPLRSDWVLQRRLRRLGLTSRAQMVRNIAQRTGYRLVPDAIRRWAYPALIARH
ncbi:glycosyltransferase [Pseudactinotalea sp. Z1732]|uniref:glycosyltransferase n=1 Tax=Micrococcales TaxID=85006 RepID=UPI003C7DD87A